MGKLTFAKNNSFNNTWWHYFFFSTCQNKLIMEFLPVILTFVGAYGLFLFLAYILARVFFPTIDFQDDEKPKKIRSRHSKRLVGH
jgi:hypothetical protein